MSADRRPAHRELSVSGPRPLRSWAAVLSPQESSRPSHTSPCAAATSLLALGMVELYHVSRKFFVKTEGQSLIFSRIMAVRECKDTILGFPDVLHAPALVPVGLAVFDEHRRDGPQAGSILEKHVEPVVFLGGQLGEEVIELLIRHSGHKLLSGFDIGPGSNPLRFEPIHYRAGLNIKRQQRVYSTCRLSGLLGGLCGLLRLGRGIPLGTGLRA